MLTLLNVPSVTDAWVHLVSAQARIRWAGLRLTLRRAHFDLRSAASRSHPFAVASKSQKPSAPFSRSPGVLAYYRNAMKGRQLNARQRTREMKEAYLRENGIRSSLRDETSI